MLAHMLLGASRLHERIIKTVLRSQHGRANVVYYLMLWLEALVSAASPVVKLPG